MIQVESKPFLKALRQVINATARVSSGQRKILSYIHVKVYEGTMVVEATNAHILANQTVPARVSQPDQNHSFIDEELAKLVNNSDLANRINALKRRVNYK